MSKQSASAIVECLIRRQGGSDIEMADGEIIPFRPNKDGAHVAIVSKLEHLTRFMQIPDAYRILSLEQASTGATVSTGAVTTQPTPSAPQNADETGKTDAVASADVASATDTSTDPLNIPAAEADGSYSEASDKRLREIFKIELGRTPSFKTKPETMIAQIEAIREERAKGGGAA